LYLKQISDDEIHGDTASNTVLQEVLDGNRTNLFALGPAIGYDLGPVRVYGSGSISSRRRTPRKETVSGSGLRRGSCPSEAIEGAVTSFGPSVRRCQVGAGDAV
jgi:hypothetical protein